MTNYQDVEAYKIGMKYYNDKACCAVVALAVACSVGYGKAFHTLKRLGRVTGQGTPQSMSLAALHKLGYNYKPVPFKNCTISTITRQLDHEKTYLVRVRGHILAVRNGDVIDWSKGRKHRVLMVLEITKKEEA
tara:strand:- start:485 stop:883 length:399 start_codon:yes stop_codon:yes gene_type:complete